MRQPKIMFPTRSNWRGFTMLEMLIAIGTALDEYSSAFHGEYPSFSIPADDYANAQTNPSTSAAYPWIDYRNYRGALLLCRALISPGPGVATSTDITSQPVEVQGEDGATGSGFRPNRLLSFINGSWAVTGKTYGPYVDASKFKLIKAQTSDPDGAQMIADASGNPILYYPAATGSPTPNLFYADPTTYNPTGGVPAQNYLSAQYPMPRFNGYDNQNYLDSTSGGTTFSSTSSFAILAANCGSPPYLLWTAGIDGKFGLINNSNKTDDIANFDMPNSK